MNTTGYWTISHGAILRNGHTCRACRRYIRKGDQVVVRTGRKTRYFYHDGCYAGTSDPRTQPGSSFNQDRLPTVCFAREAPAVKGDGKWSTRDYHYRPKTLSEQFKVDTDVHELRKQRAPENKPQQAVATWDKVALPPFSARNAADNQQRVYNEERRVRQETKKATVALPDIASS